VKNQTSIILPGPPLGQGKIVFCCGGGGAPGICVRAIAFHDGGPCCVRVVAGSSAAMQQHAR